MYDFLIAQEYTDVNIVCNDQQVFKCHRLVLAVASEYFETMFYRCFKEKRDEEVFLRDVDGTTFKEILRFAYEGDVLIDDKNVFKLLSTAEALGLHFIENLCVQYLTERNIPMCDAIQIFLFACITQNYTLIPTLSSFILKHLDSLRYSNEFLEIPFAEFNTLLTYFSPSSQSKEEALLRAICQWVSHSTMECKKSSFDKLTQNIKFQHLSKRYIREYFDKNTSDCYNEGCKSERDNLNTNFNFERNQLHVYVNYPNYNTPQLYASGARITKVLTLQKLNGNIHWYLSHTIQQDILLMRTVAFKDRIYSWKLESDGEQTFSVCSSSDLSSNMRSLCPPPLSNIYPICGDQNKIYTIEPGEITSNKLFIYNCELDQWSSIWRKKMVPSMILTHTDGRLYHIGSKFFGDRPVLRAYDHRAGIWERLVKEKTRRFYCRYYDECCSHKEKIYLTCFSLNDLTSLDVYNPRAGKWDSSVKLFKSKDDFTFQRLLSYENQLWMFYHDMYEELCTQIYDSFLQKCIVSEELDNYISRTTNVYSHCRIVDATAFKF